MGSKNAPYYYYYYDYGFSITNDHCQSYLIYVNKNFLTFGYVCFPYSDMAFVLVSKLATRPGFARVQY